MKGMIKMKLKVKMNTKAMVSLVLILILTSGNLVYASNNLEVKERSKLEIIENYYNNSFDFTKSKERVEYVVEPSLDIKYNAGELKQKYIDEALRAVNFTRFLVGLPDDIKINQEYNSYAQHASAVNAKNNVLTHYPSKPEGMPKEFYDLGYKGASSSNMGLGYYNIKDSIIHGYMEDEDTSNISVVGHRRWILNPPMKEIGFGYANKYTATYVFDHERKQEIKYDLISWPAKGYMPIEYITKDTPWSINLGKHYDTPQLNTVEVILKNVVTGQEWVFNKNSNKDPALSITKEYFNIDNSGYGMSKCIIFRPNVKEINYNEEDIFEVIVNGIHINGKEAPIKYRVNMFSLKDSPSTWAFGEVKEAIESYLVPEDIQRRYTENITRFDFCKLVVNFLEVITGKSIDVLLVERDKTIDANAFTDTSDIIILSANALGIVSGKGYGIFDASGSITRQEAAVMLTRAANILDIDINTKDISQFSDSKSIAEWAKESVNFVSSAYDKTTGAKIMGGVGNNKFEPTNLYTRQQAFITIKRLFNYN